MTPELTGSARPRPLRIAFLVEDAEYSELILDGIFADCYDRWGGRFSLIVPCNARSISISYWPWLEAFDPDIVYSYVLLERSEILKIYERLSPSRYIHRPQRGAPRLDVFGFKPIYDFTPLASLSTIFRLVRATFPGVPGGPLKIIDKWHYGGDPSRWLTDNFGTYLSCRATGIFPVDALQAARLLVIVPPDAAAHPHVRIPPDLETVPSEMAAFAEFAAQRAGSMSTASLRLAPRLDVEGGTWSQSFNLVVGNTFADRVMFWNARLLLPSWLDSDLYCFRIDEAQLEDAEFVGILSEFLRNRNHVTVGGGQPQLTIRSCSLGPDRLEAARQKIVATRLWGPPRVETVGSLDSLVPSPDSFSRSRENQRDSSTILGRATWTNFVWTPPTVRQSLITPDHLADAPPRQAFIQGCWATDYILEHDGPTGRFLIRNRWQLPHRWKMEGAFKVSRVDPHVAFPPARRGREGSLSIIQNLDHPVEHINVPTVQDAVYYALAVDGSWVDALREGEVYPPSKVVRIESSNEARYLAGVLGMAGSLDGAEAILVHPFWMGVFRRLGGSTNVPNEKMQPIANSLAKQLGHTPMFDLRNERERTTLAALIVKAGKTLNTPASDLELQRLKSDWEEYVNDYYRRRQPNSTEETSVEIVTRERASLDQCLIAMRARKMIFQGHRWSCDECHHKNWFDLTALKPRLTCEVCGNVEDAPIDIKWLFKPNEFLIESLRDHSTLSLIWTLAGLRNRSRSSFMYLPPTKFGYSREGGSDAEADLLVVSDGKCLVCEVKSSWQVLRVIDITKLVALAKKLRPDEVVLAVMDEGIELDEELRAARLDLETVGITFSLMTMVTNPLQHSPYLFN